MKRTSAILALILLVFVAMILAVYFYNYPTYSWRQRLTLTVSTPDGVKSASSVIQQKIAFRPVLLPDAGERVEHIWGEAVVLDLGDGRYLFALLDGDIGMFDSAFGDALPGLSYGGETMQAFLRAVTRLRGVRELPFEHLPMLITFADLDDLSSVQLVDPEDLEATFGDGFELSRALLEVTNDRVTTGPVRTLLPCLNTDFSCVPVNFDLRYGDPLRHIQNKFFRRD